MDCGIITGYDLLQDMLILLVTVILQLMVKLEVE